MGEEGWIRQKAKGQMMKWYERKDGDEKQKRMWQGRKSREKSGKGN